MSNTKFKYHLKHEELGCDCPNMDNLESINNHVYRWLFSDLTHINNHLPPFLISPNRIDSEDDCKSKCDGFALSMFTDLVKAEKKYIKLVKRKPLLVEVFGNGIGKLKLIESDGMADKPSKSSSHFNFHEFENENNQFIFEYIKDIKIE